MKKRVVDLLTWLGAITVALLLMVVVTGGWLTQVAVEQNSLPLMRTLLVFGISTEWGDPDLKITPLMNAASDNKIELVKLLIDNGADINAMDQSNDDPLMYAVLGGHTDVARLFLERGSSPTRKNASGGSAYSIAQQNKDTTMLSLLGQYLDNIAVEPM